MCQLVLWYHLACMFCLDSKKKRYEQSYFEMDADNFLRGGSIHAA